MKTSLGIWAFGNMATRFNPGGYKPELAGVSTAEKVRTAVAGLGDLMDDYEFHYPQELSRENLEEVQDALDGHGIYCLASGLHLDPRFGKGGFSSPDDATRAEALRLTLEAIDLAADVGAQMIIWPGIEGYNYPFQTPYAQLLGAVHRRDRPGGRATRSERGVTVFLEHKNSEPAMKILMRNIGMTLHVIHTLRAQGIDNVKVNMDWQHLIMNGENLAEYAALLAAEGLLGHQHANSGWGTFDDDNMVGATAFMETLELARRAAPRRLRRARRAARLRPLPLHRGRRRRRETVGAAVALHRRHRREDRRAELQRGAAGQRRSPRLRARVRRTRRLARDQLGRPRRRHDRRQGVAIYADGRVLASAAEEYPLSTPRPGWAEQDPEDWWRAAQACLERLPAGRSGSRGRCTGSSCSTREDRCCAPRSSGTTSAPAPSARRSSRGSGSTG